MVSVDGAVPCWLAFGLPIALTYLLLRVLLAPPGNGIVQDFRIAFEVAEELLATAAAVVADKGNETSSAQELR